MLGRPTSILSCVVLLGIATSAPAASSGAGFTAPGYLPLDPPFVLNLEASKRTRFMQITVQSYVENQEQAEAIRYHIPAVRNALIILLSGETVDEASSVETREQWRGEVLA